MHDMHTTVGPSLGRDVGGLQLSGGLILERGGDQGGREEEREGGK